MDREYYQGVMREITGNPAFSLDEKRAALSELIDKMIVELIAGTPKQKHWPGRFNPKKNRQYFYPWTGVMLNHDQEITDMHRAQGMCCETEKEAEFVREQMEAELAVIDRLAELNEGWRPEKDVDSYEPFLDRDTGKIIIERHSYAQILPDCQLSKSSEIWKQVISEFGKEKIKLAIWPQFNPAD